jgi:hypothetical protein
MTRHLCIAPHTFHGILSAAVLNLAHTPAQTTCYFFHDSDARVDSLDAISDHAYDATFLIGCEAPGGLDSTGVSHAFVHDPENLSLLRNQVIAYLYTLDKHINLKRIVVEAYEHIFNAGLLARRRDYLYQIKHLIPEFGDSRLVMAELEIVISQLCVIRGQEFTWEEIFENTVLNELLNVQDSQAQAASLAALNAREWLGID